MAAPRSRRLRNQTAPVVHTRREMTIAIGGSVLVVIATVILVWAMRPGPTTSLTPGSGGIIHRQTKASLWLLVTVLAIGLVSWSILRPESKVRNRTRAALLGITGVVVAAVVVMAVWHDNLVRDYSVPTVPTVPTSVPASVPSTTLPRTSTTARGAATTTAPGATTTPTPRTTRAPSSPSTTGG